MLREKSGAERLLAHWLFETLRKTCLSDEPLPWSRATWRMVRFRLHRLCKSAVPARSTWVWVNRGAVRARSGKVMDSPATDLAADTCRAHSDQVCRWPLERPCKTQSRTKSWEHILECSPLHYGLTYTPSPRRPEVILEKSRGRRKEFFGLQMSFHVQYWSMINRRKKVRFIKIKNSFPAKDITGELKHKPSFWRKPFQTQIW